MPDLLQAATRIQSQLVAWRRDLHRHPELRFQEFRTAGIVAETLRGLGLEVQTGVGRTGVVGLLRGADAKLRGPTVLLRFDMDALPIQEENEVDYASQNPGVMHACGHDTHVAMGLGTAQLLSERRELIHGAVKFVFQPAEEGAGGALAMIENGVLENPRPDYAFGLHIDATRPLGTAAIGSGPILAAADLFEIVLRGRGGHGALPELADDVLLAGAQVVCALQAIISRDVGLKEAAVLSVCSFNAGNAFNIIPDRAELSGTLRSYTEATQQLMHRRMREIVQGIAAAFGVTAEVDIRTIVPAAYNDPDAAAVSCQLASQFFDTIETDYWEAPSDDMAEFLKAAPGCQIMVGAALPAGHMHHTARFDIDERAMPQGVALLCAQALHYLSDNRP